MIKTFFSIIILAVAFSFFNAGQPERMPHAPENPHLQNLIPRDRIRPGVDLIIAGEYAQAVKYIDTLDERDDFVRHFLNASLLYARMGELETSLGRDKFIAESAWIVSAAQQRLARGGGDVAARFYLGTIQVYQSVIYSKEGRYIKAFQTARSGVKNLEKCLEADENFPEAHLARGAYRYWKSAKNFLRFLPGIPDERKSGIQEIRSSLFPESTGYALGLNQLIWILLDFNDIPGAEKAAAEGLRRYPGSRFFLYPAGIIAQRRSRWKEAARYFEQTAQSLADHGLRNRYFWIKVTLKRAESLYAAGRFNEALRLCRSLRVAPVIPYEKKKSVPLLERARRLETACLKKI